jgi:hypothetical protein
LDGSACSMAATISEAARGLLQFIVFNWIKHASSKNGTGSGVSATPDAVHVPPNLFVPNATYSRATRRLDGSSASSAFKIR